MPSNEINISDSRTVWPDIQGLRQLTSSKRGEDFYQAEQLDHIRLMETEATYEVIIQFDGGGVYVKIGKDDKSHVVSGKLRHLAGLIDSSIAERAK